MKTTDWKEYAARAEQCREAEDEEGFIKNSQSAFFFLFLRLAVFYIDCNSAEQLYIDAAARHIGRIVTEMAEERHEEAEDTAKWKVVKSMADQIFNPKRKDIHERKN